MRYFYPAIRGLQNVGPLSQRVSLLPGPNAKAHVVRRGAYRLVLSKFSGCKDPSGSGTAASALGQTS